MSDIYTDYETFIEKLLDENKRLREVIRTSYHGMEAAVGEYKDDMSKHDASTLLGHMKRQDFGGRAIGVLRAEQIMFRSLCAHGFDKDMSFIQ